TAWRACSSQRRTRARHAEGRPLVGLIDMTSLLASRAARRRGIAFAVLLVISVMLMAFSSNPGVRELQNGVSFAFRPIQGALDEVARGAASVAAAVSEIDRLRVDNAA